MNEKGIAVSNEKSTAIEVHARFTILPGQMQAFETAVNAGIELVRENEPGTTRYDWFIDAEHLDAVAMDTYADEAALFAHLGNMRKAFPAILAHAKATMSLLGNPGERVLVATRPMALAQYEFLGGIEEVSAARHFRRTETRTTGQAPGHIEILTRFEASPGHWPRFVELAREHIEVVKGKDPGTVRYDWFVDESRAECITLDTYRDTASLFAHMRNCHDIHGEFLQISRLSTVFLGELPEEAAKEVAKYKPRELPFYRGLRGYSSGGLT